MLNFPSWISGFVDGEGYFVIAKNKERGTFRCEFGIELRDDDADILHKIRDHLSGIGNIYARKRTFRYINEKPAVVWRVCKHDHVMMLIYHFEKYPLQAKKNKHYQLWRQAAFEIRKPKSERDLALLDALKGNLHLCKQYEEICVSTSSLE